MVHENKEHNSQDQHKNSKNILIKGDNLEVLKHLVNAYSEKIKMIYIDPPYNTGGDGFAYHDERKFTKEQLSELANIDLDEAERVLGFNDKGSNSHSAWLTFIYPRLYVARELLSDDGLIFISIDNNEVAQLRLLIDEIYGEENVLGVIANTNNPKGRSDDKFIATAHEYLFVIAKNKHKARTHGFEPEDKITKRYNKTDDNGKKFREIDLRKTGDADRREDREDMFYYFYYCDKTQDLSVSKTKLAGTEKIEIIPLRDDDSEGRWRWGFDTAKSRLKDVYPKFMPKRKIWGIMEKDYLEGRPPVKPTSSWTHKDVNTERGSEQFVELGFNKEVFPKPKPLGLINRALQIGTQPSETAIVMDFFAGSGTFAHAVLEKNVNDNQNLSFISIQLDEKTKKDSQAFKDGFTSIFDITKARIERCSQKLLAEGLKNEFDLGFKIFETVDDFRVRDKKQEFSLSNLTMFDDVMLTQEQYETLLTTWALYDGSELTTPISNIDLGGYTAHLCDRRLYMIAPDFSSNALKALLHKLDDTDDKDFDPNKIVYYANNFDSVKQMELNEALKSYANKKSIEIDVVVRN